MKNVILNMLKIKNRKKAINCQNIGIISTMKERKRSILASINKCMLKMKEMAVSLSDGRIIW